MKNGGQVQDSFYGLSREMFRGDRFYKMYVTSEAIIGIKVGGQFFDKTSVRVQLMGLYLTVIGVPFLEAFASWVNNRRLRIEAEAESNLSVAAQNDDSIFIPLFDVRLVELSDRRNWWTLWLNSGMITLHRGNDEKIVFVLTGNQDTEQIADTLRRCDLEVGR